MATDTQNDNITLDDFSEEQVEEMEDEEEETKEEAFDDQQELIEEYGSPDPEEKHNSHFIINKAIEKIDTVRTTYLTESELGRPLFSVRFLSDLHDDALRHNLDRITKYYWEKIQNITSSGMSNKGFVMNLNVTQKRDQTRRRVRENQIPDKGAKK